MNINVFELRSKRLALGLTTTDMADIMHISRQTLSYLENGKHIKESALNYYRLVLDELWGEIPYDEREARLCVGNAGHLYNPGAGQMIKQYLNIKKEES